MKKIISILVFILLANLTVAQTYLGDNKLVLDGEAKLIVESDRASFTYKVIGYGSDLREAVTVAKEKITATVSALSNYGVKKNNINTSLFQSGENRTGSAFLSSSKDYLTKINISVIVDSLDLLEEIILVLSEMDVEEISNIKFSLKDYTKYEEKVRKMSIDNAKEKAQKIAKEFDVKIKKVIYISTSGLHQGYPNPFNPSTNIDLSIESSIGFYAKPIKLSNKIKVVYEIE